MFGEGEGGKPMGQTRAYMELKSIPDAMRRLRGASRQPTGGNRATAGQSKLSSPPQGAEMEEVGAAGSYHHGGDGGVAVFGDGNRELDQGPGLRGAERHMRWSQRQIRLKYPKPV